MKKSLLSFAVFQYKKNMSQSVEDQQNKIEDTRTTYVKLENKWKYIHQALVKKWVINKKDNAIANLVVNINGIDVRPSKVTDTEIIFNFKTLRAKWLELLGQTPTECDLMALEDECEVAQLQAMSHYDETPLDVIRGCLFTPSFTIHFLPEYTKKGKDVQPRIEVQETYIISDAQKQK